MRQLRRIFIIGSSLIVAALAAVAVGLQAQDVAIAAQTSPAAIVARDSNDIGPEAAGAALYTTYCALCHEGPRADAQAPSHEIMTRMSAEQVLESLERGSMRARAAERGRAQRRALAVYVSGKPLLAGTGDSTPTSAFCSRTPAPPPNPLAGPAWNGWGHGITNARFQSADAAGMSATDLPRLKLTWAFGFPGASSAGTQPVVAGGRVYVATAEGDVFALDGKTGCIHWTLEVEAGIRSAITLEERGNGDLVAYFGDQSANIYAVDAKVGKVLWRVEVDEHPHAAVTAAPQLYNGRLYVPVSSREESQVGDPRYPCC